MDIIENELKKLSLMSAYTFLTKNPEENLPKLMDWLDAYMSKDVLTKQRDAFREIVKEKDGNWYQLIISLWSDLDDAMRKKLFENIIINANALAASKVKENKIKYDCNIPRVVSIALGDEKEGLGFEVWDRVIDESKELGTFAYVIDGEEPLKSKEALIALANKNRDCEFMVLTDGTLIDEDFIRQVLRVKNLIICLRTENTKMDADLVRATDLLRKFKVPFAAMAIYDEERQELFAKEEYFDDLIAHGVKMVFFASSVRDRDDLVYDKVQEYRKTKSIFSIHFCKDRHIIGGCIAGGRYYCNINANGDVEPCFLLHKSDSNITTGSLLDAYQAPLFCSFREECDKCELL